MLLPSRAAMRRVLVLLTAVAAAVALTPGATAPAIAQGDAMTVDQVLKMPKIDAHAHIGAMSPGHLRAFVAFLEQYNLRWLNICVGGMDWGRLSRQIGSAQALHAAQPDRIAWATVVHRHELGPGRLGEGRERHDRRWVRRRRRGGIKNWKDVGMVLKDPDGKYVMADDPRLDPVLSALAKNGRTLVAHLGEPRYCWLPVDQMTVDGGLGAEGSQRPVVWRLPQCCSYSFGKEGLSESSGYVWCWDDTDANAVAAD